MEKEKPTHKTYLVFVIPNSDDTDLIDELIHGHHRVIALIGPTVPDERKEALKVMGAEVHIIEEIHRGWERFHGLAQLFKKRGEVLDAVIFSALVSKKTTDQPKGMELEDMQYFDVVLPLSYTYEAFSRNLSDGGWLIVMSPDYVLKSINWFLNGMYGYGDPKRRQIDMHFLTARGDPATNVEQVLSALKNKRRREKKKKKKKAKKREQGK